MKTVPMLFLLFILIEQVEAEEIQSALSLKPIKLSAEEEFKKEHKVEKQFIEKANTLGDAIKHVSGVQSSSATTSYNSFFGILNGSVRNVGFKDAVVACEKSGTGILAGYVGHDQFKNEDATKAYSKIENVWVSGKITGSNSYIGGFFGTVAGPTAMKNCYNTRKS